VRRLAPLLLLAGAAAAQPMIDPSQMSGIPRPDDKTPPGAIVVRLLRGDFAHPLVGHEVTLDGPGGARTAKTDEGGRALFNGLAAGQGAYVAKAALAGKELASQPMDLPPSPGVRVMLVFPRDEKELLGEPDGEARTDEKLPEGTVEAKLVDGDDRPLAGVEVVLAHGVKTEGDAKVDEKRATSDGSGRARFAGLPVTGADGYLLSVRRDGSTTASKPFRLGRGAGSLVALRILPVTRDAKVVAFGKQSHVIAEVQDDTVNVFETLVVENSSANPFAPEGGAVRIPLPEGAKGARLGDNPPPGASVEGNEVVWKGSIPAGETAITLGYVLEQQGGAVAIRHAIPFALEELKLITDRYSGMEVEGPGLQKMEREMNGRKFWLASGPRIAAGGSIDVTLRGLPARSTLWRWIAAAIAFVIAGWGLWQTLFAPAPARPSRAALEEKRQKLLAAAGSAKDPRKREELIGKLEDVYRALDEAGP
jgi:hypothetical protein